MKKKYFVLFLIFTSYFLNSQTSSVPPPTGFNPFFAIDDNNDGFAEFNTNYILETLNKYKESPDYDLSSYELQLYPSQEDLNNGTNLIGASYTNTIANRQDCYLKFVYSGSGIKYDEDFLNHYFTGPTLITLPFDGDFDKDGVLNAEETVPLIIDSNTSLNLYIDTDGDGLYNFQDKDDDGDGILTINEDTNHNGNYQDDDSNGNAIPDYLDSKNTLTLNQDNKNSFTITPNPAFGFINLNLDNTVANYKVSIYDTSGKLVLQTFNSNLITISSLKSGIYILKVKTDTHSMTKKLIVL